MLEFNVRFGDPETQVILPLLADDLVELLLKSARGVVMPNSVAFKNEAAMVVVLASKGYPGSYPKGEPISEPEETPSGSVLIHAGTQEKEGSIVTAGGRVLGAVGIGPTLADAKSRAYQLAEEFTLRVNISEPTSGIANFQEPERFNLAFPRMKEEMKESRS